MSTQIHRQPSVLFSRKMFTPALGGAAAFWVASILTSLLPIAKEYRAAYSNWSPQTVWIASFPVGLVLGCIVSVSLIRWLETRPSRKIIRKSVLLSGFALIVVLVLIDIPMMLLKPGSGAAMYYFLVGGVFNAVRFLLLGFAVGYLHKRQCGVSAET